MSYVWSNDLTTGNTTIDSQHKQLIQAINNLMDACASGKGRDHIDKVLKFLSDYTAKHFGDEEKLQQQYKYPDFPNHKKMHDGFKNTVAELGKQIKVEGPTIVMLGKINSTVGAWLVRHIQNEDKKVVAHINRSTPN